jgi:hypothetical protein
MIAGVPGTGIGGIYYVLLVAWMPVREFIRMLAGARGFRLRTIATLVVLAVTIVGALWVEAVVLKWLLMQWLVASTPGVGGDIGRLAMLRSSAAAEADAVVPMVGLVAITLLALVVAGVHALRLLARRSRSAVHV